jgi:pyridinium-3,5-bisthiocarboxylic acid mononucleotide nickel chelatase
LVDTTSRLLYLDPWSGVAGDMILAALLDAAGGAASSAEAALREAVGHLGLGDVGLTVSRVAERGVSSLRVGVEAPAGDRPVRDLAVAEDLLSASGLPERVTERSARALRRLAEVEASIHGIPVDQVHFHELGAVDTLVDVVGAFVLVDTLGIGEVVHGSVPVGSGRLSCEHGVLGVPAPATLQLLSGRPVMGGREQSEVTTPTGALLLTELAAEAGPIPPMTVENVGYGAGHRTLEHGPNLLRAIVGRRLPGTEPAPAQDTEARGSSEVILETVIDDASPEVLAHAAERLRAEGAVDVWWVPAEMKKGRLGTEMRLLVRAEDEQRLLEILFLGTGTFGVRRSPAQRWTLEREVVLVDVRGHIIPVKLGRWKGSVVAVAAEFEPCATAAAALGWPVRWLMDEAAHAARARLGL